jgi:hypothetical protein
VARGGIQRWRLAAIMGDLDYYLSCTLGILCRMKLIDIIPIFLLDESDEIRANYCRASYFIGCSYSGCIILWAANFFPRISM